MINIKNVGHVPPCVIVSAIKKPEAARGQRNAQRGILFFVAALGVAAAGPVSAGPSFTALGSAPSATPVSYASSGPVSGNTVVSEYGAAGVGTAGSSISVSGPGPNSVYTGFVATQPTFFNFDDVTISGPGSGMVSTSLNFQFSGTIGNVPSISGFQDGSVTSIGGASAEIAVGGGPQYASGLWTLGGGTEFTGTLSNTTVVCAAAPGNLCTGSVSDLPPTGLLAGLTAGGGLYSGRLTTPVFNAPLNTPFSVGFALSTYVNVVGTATPPSVSGNGLPSDAMSDYLTADFADPFSFPSSGPVINLPQGLTVNSTEGMITDNQFVGNPAAVPIPAAVWLFGSGLLGLIGIARRKKTSTSAIPV